MRTLFWLSFFVVIYAYFGYPFLLMLLSRKKRESDTHNSNDRYEQSASLIIPVHNEEKIISDKIQNTLSLDYPKNKLEILIISDGSTDRTGEIARRYGNDGVKYFEQPVRKGKAAALNRGLREAKNEIIVFSDASIILEEKALRNLLRRFSDKRTGCVSGEDYIPGEGGEGAYGRYELFLRNLESRIGSIVGASGCFYAQRRDLCEPFPEGLAPDFFSVLKTVEKGFRAVTEPTAKGMMRSVPDPKSEFERKVRTLLRGMTTLIHFKHLLNPFKFGIFSIQLISHKLIRWSIGVFLILLFFSNLFLLSSKIYATFFWLQVAFYGMAAIGWMGSSRPFIFRIPFFFSMVNLSALVAWGKYLSGHRQEIWEPSKR
ncbi:MAG: glycosyltransferase family 2 protein [Deltaproteobacteria bacterium]|nr:glycosyltransferase family 2 protein [Deltaproteobacteria bacterium]